MSKYDQLDYISQYERINKDYPDCVKNLSKKIIDIPEELSEGVTTENFKNCLKLETNEDKKNFIFFNNNQTYINNEYLKNANYITNDMNAEEKKDFLIDYLIFLFGEKVDGNYFENNLQDIFNLRGKNFSKEDFDFMIEKQFKKNEINLKDDSDRNEFKKIIEDDINLISSNNNINNINNSNDFSNEFNINTKM